MGCRRSRLVVFVLASLCSTVSLAKGPAQLHYQGVLREADGTPLDGAIDMRFSFYSAESGGDEILIDEHRKEDTGPVVVSEGLFSVALGSGNVVDGSGPGTYLSLETLFAKYGTVYLEIEVKGETLAPRVHVISSAYAMNAARLDGNLSGEFLNVGSSVQTKSGPLHVVPSGSALVFGFESEGRGGGGYFRDSDDSGYAYVGYKNNGVEGRGTQAGGRFFDSDDTGQAYLGYGDRGVYGRGSLSGGYFVEDGGSGITNVCYQGYGIHARGNEAGGYFEDRDGTGTASVATQNYGIEAYGDSAGGRFESSLAGAYTSVGGGGTGIFAKAGGTGGRFLNNGTGAARLAYGDFGVRAVGADHGGLFANDEQLSDTYARLAYTEEEFSYGIEAVGKTMGGYFLDRDAGLAARVAFDTYKIQGAGTMSFVQNHPYEKSEVIVYAAPEGDEVATYTRGSARLVGTEVRVPLGETFSLVTNPDIGLTAHVTPRGGAATLYVAAVTTQELVVRSAGDEPVELDFDYLVYGLRIGFEDHNVVQPKTEEAPIPAMQVHAEQVATDPSLARYTARTRFHAMRAKSGLQAPAADGAAARLQQAVGVHTGPVNVTRPAPETPIERATPSIDEQEATNAQRDAETTEPGLAAAIAVPASEEAAPATEVLLPVSEPVVPGDLLVIDPERPGSFRRSRSAEDRTVVGVVREASRTVGDSLVAPVALAGVIEVAVDASYGPILPGDLLASSPTPGHAMIATVPDARSVVAKALAALPAGKGRILALVK